MINFINEYLKNTKQILEKINVDNIIKTIDIISNLKKNNGRIFLGVGGSAANCSHAVNDFRKIANIECYTPIDNVSELSARINDDSWKTVFTEYLKVSNFDSKDILFILSVGGGDIEKKVSTNIVDAIQYSKKTNSKSVGIVGNINGYTAKNADSCIIIPEVNKERITPLFNLMHSLIWHLIVTHPDIKSNNTKWETRKKNKNS